MRPYPCPAITFWPFLRPSSRPVRSGALGMAVYCRDSHGCQGLIAPRMWRLGHRAASGMGGGARHQGSGEAAKFGAGRSFCIGILSSDRIRREHSGREGRREAGLKHDCCPLCCEDDRGGRV
jgi:hypothetical protein